MLKLENLPEALVSSVYSHWLTVVDVARLDSALCHHRRRSYFLCTAYAKSTPLQRLSDWKPDNECEGWILIRSANVLDVFITDCMLYNPELRGAYLLKNGGTIRSVTFPSLDYINYLRYRLLALEFVAHCSSLMILEGAGSLADEDWYVIVLCCPLLQEITDINVTESSIALIAQSCTRLRKVGFDCRMTMTEALVLALCTNAPNLVHVIHDSREEKSFTDETIQRLALHCPGLTALDIGAARLTFASIHALALHCGQLRCLYLRMCSMNGPALIRLATACNLHTLHLYDMSVITPAALDEIAVVCPNLRSLHMGQPYATPICYTNINCICVLLEELEIFGIDNMNNCFSFLDQQCTLMRKLKVTGCDNSTMLEICALMRHCSYLERLDYSYSSADDAFLTLVADHCHALNALIVLGAASFTDVGLLAVAAGCAHLTTFAVQDKTIFTDEGMKRAYALHRKLRVRAL
jgi:hypothetical protein